MDTQHTHVDFTVRRGDRVTRVRLQIPNHDDGPMVLEDLRTWFKVCKESGWVTATDVSQPK